MKTHVSSIAGLLLSMAAVVFSGGGFTGQAQLQEPTAYIDPAVLDALQEQPEVEVYVALRRLETPLAEQTSEVQRQHAAEVQAGVLSVLTPADFTLTYQFEFSGLAGRITESGLEKLASQPDVTSIALPSKGEWLSIVSGHSSHDT